MVYEVTVVSFAPFCLFILDLWPICQNSLSITCGGFVRGVPCTVSTTRDVYLSRLWFVFLVSEYET